jgi:hypothetical protein
VPLFTVPQLQGNSAKKIEINVAADFADEREINPEAITS